jgi:catechol 2,3-dioxygenase-like lactoylglutathione lyase family enzyme
VSDRPGDPPRNAVVTVGHIGIVCRSEPMAARFYGELLGLRQADTKTLPAALARQLFGIDAELPIVNYVGDGSRVLRGESSALSASRTARTAVTASANAIHVSPKEA